MLTPTVQPKLCKWFYSHHTLADRTTWWTALNVYDAIFLIIGVLLWSAVAGVLTNPPNGSMWNNPTYCPKYIATYQWLSKFLGLFPKSTLSQLSTKNLGQAVAWCMNGSTIPMEAPISDAELAAREYWTLQALSLCLFFIKASQIMEKPVSCRKQTDPYLSCQASTTFVTCSMQIL